MQHLIQQKYQTILKKNGGFIPGIRAGKPTTEYLSSIISKLTWFGGFFLAVLQFYQCY